MSAEVRIIAALTRDGSIGDKGDLLVKDKEDLRRFKENTMGGALVMGRKTFESLPCLLPGRKHYVISKAPWGVSAHKGEAAYKDTVFFAANLKDALALAKRQAAASGRRFVDVIGGGEVYKQAICHADSALITTFDCDLTGDTKFPVDLLNKALPNSREVAQWRSEVGKATLTCHFREADSDGVYFAEDEERESGDCVDIRAGWLLYDQQRIRLDTIQAYRLARSRNVVELDLPGGQIQIRMKSRDGIERLFNRLDETLLCTASNIHFDPTSGHISLYRN